MVMITSAYLFDVPGFRRLVAPVVAELFRGDVAVLRTTAWQVAAANPHIWSMLGAQKLARADLDQDEARFPDLPRRTNLWMLTILAAFWQPLRRPVFGPPWVWSPLADALSAEAANLEHLLIGKSQRALLQPAGAADPFARPANKDDWPAWCWFGELPELTDWLDLADVRQYLPLVQAWRDTIVQTRNRTALDQYETILDRLTRAAHAERGLFIAATD